MMQGVVEVDAQTRAIREKEFMLICSMKVKRNYFPIRKFISFQKPSEERKAKMWMTHQLGLTQNERTMEEMWPELKTQWLRTLRIRRGDIVGSMKDEFHSKLFIPA
jgi:hypothetical protein